MLLTLYKAEVHGMSKIFYVFLLWSVTFGEWGMSSDLKFHVRLSVCVAKLILFMLLPTLDMFRMVEGAAGSPPFRAQENI